MALKQDDPLDPQQQPETPGAWMKKDVEERRLMNDIGNGPEIGEPLSPDNEYVDDPSLQGMEPADGAGGRFLRRTQRNKFARYAQAGTGQTITDGVEEDISQPYARMAETRSTDAELEQFREQMRRRKNEEFEKPKQAIPYVVPATGAPTAEGAGALPWHQQKTIPEMLQAVVNNAKNANWADTASITGAVAKDVGKGVFMESPRAIVRGMTTAGRELLVSVNEFNAWFETHVSPLQQIRKNLGELGVTEKPDIEAEVRAGQEKLMQYVPKADDVADKPETVTGGFVEEAARFIAAFIPTFRAARAITATRSVGPVLGGPVGPFTQAQIRNQGIKNYATMLGAGTVAEGITHPAGDPNLASLIEAAPAFSNVVTQALATDPNDSVGWAKVKHAISDGFVSGAIADGLLYGLRVLAAKSKVTPEIEAQIRLHGTAEDGSLLTAPENAPLLHQGGPPPTNPFNMDLSTPEARTAAEGQVRELLAGEQPGIRLEAQPIYDDVFQQLRAAGLPEEEAAANAAVWAQRYATRAERLGNGQSAMDLYRQENVDIERSVRQDITAQQGDNVLEQQGDIPAHVQRLYDEGHATSDAGIMQDLTDLREMIRRKATPEEIENNPIISAAYRIGMGVKETINEPGFGTPEWRANREFNINGTTVRGYEAAQDYLYHSFISKSTNGPVRNDKKVVIVTGPGGSGKSTIMEPLAARTHSAIIDVDEAKPLFPEYNGGVGANAVHEESSIITFIEGGPFRRLIEEGANMLIQKIGHSPESLRRLIDLLEARGYTVDTINVKVDPDESFRRRIGRYIRTGRINSNGYSHSLNENADQPGNTHNLLVKEGRYGQAVQVDLNDKAKITAGNDAELAATVQDILDKRVLPDDQPNGGPGQRRSDGQVYDRGAGGNGPSVEFDPITATRVLDQSGLVRAAAVKINGEIFEGPSHFDALLEASKKLNRNEDALADSLRKGDDGFVTQDGRFVSREEAARLVNLKTRFGRKALRSEDLTMNGGSFDQSGRADFGRGWWFTDGKLHSIDQGSLGPHGDHDGWITIGENAKALGIDERAAGAMQTATWGPYVNSENKYVREFIDHFPELKDADEWKMIDWWDEKGHTQEVAKVFQEVFGHDVLSSLDATIVGNLTRVRAWPGGTLTIDTAGNIKSPRKFVDEMLASDPKVFDGVKKVQLEIDGDYFQLSLEDFMDGKWNRKSARIFNQDASVDPSFSESWTGKWKSFQNTARQILTGTQSRYGYGFHTSAVKELLTEIDKSKTNNGTMYRGVSLDNVPEVGDTFSESLTSWSKSRQLANQFATQYYSTADDPGKASVIFKIDRGDHTVNVSRSMDFTHPGWEDIHPSSIKILKDNDFGGEFLSSGQYKVTKVERLGTDALQSNIPSVRKPVYEVTVERVGKAKANDPDQLTFYQNPPFYSSVEQTIKGSKTNSATGQQWFAALRNTPGVRKEELEWLGLERFLKEQTGQVNRSDVEAYIAANRVEVKEVTKGGPEYAHNPEQYFSHDDLDQAISFLHENGMNARELRGLNDEQILRHANDAWEQADGSMLGSDDPRFREQQLPGGENYREVLLTLPTKAQSIKVEVKRSESGKGWQVFTNGRRTGFITDGLRIDSADGASRTTPTLTEAQALQIARQGAEHNFAGRAASQEGAYRSPHWDEPNVLAHVRLNDRVIDGKKTLFVEEIQSDWHQQGRRYGYQGRDGEQAKIPPDIQRTIDKISNELGPRAEWATNNGRLGTRVLNSLVREKILTSDEARNFGTWQVQNVVAEATGTGRMVPDAPFKKTWHELALKRIIRIAADEGYDQIAWTSGRQQADRYDLSKQVDEVQYNPETNQLLATQHGNRVMFNNNVPPEKLEDFIGKDAADKILKKPTRKDGVINIISGEDLRVGGEGMAAFYDKMLPAAANDIGKPFGAKVDSGNLSPIIPSGERGEATYFRVVDGMMEDGEWRALTTRGQQLKDGWYALREGLEDDPNPNGGGPFSTKEEAIKATEAPQPVHTLPITPELARTAQEQGFRMFQGAGQPGTGAAPEPRGRITFGENNKLIQLFQNADQSTFMHESAHLWFDELIRDAETSPQVKADWDTARAWLGIEEGAAPTREQHEKWASAFEQYIATGEAPSEALKGAFERFKEWLVSIYHSVTGTGGQMSPEIKDVFDRMLANDAELAASGRKRIFDEQGNLAPELQPVIGQRLQSMGYDAMAVNGAVTRFDPRGVTAAGKLNAAAQTTDAGVPTPVVAAGVARVADSPAEVYINFGRINTPKDVQQAIQNMADAFRPEIDEARRGIQTNEQTSQLAEQLGMSVEDLLNRQQGQPLNAEQSLAARRMLTTSAEQLKMLAEKAAMPTSSLADQYNFRKMLAVHHAIQSEVISARTETARALQAWSIQSTNNIEMARDIQSLIDSSGGGRTAQELARATADLFAQGVPPGAIATLTRRGWAATTVDAAKEIFTLGLLWALPTHVANFASNLSVAFMQVYERASAKMIGDLLDTGNGRIVSGEALAMAYGMISSLKDAFKLAGIAAVRGKSQYSPTSSKMDDQLGAIGSHIISRERGHTLAESEAFAATPLGRFLDFLGHANQIPGGLLSAEDEFAKTIVWRGEVHAQALRQATEEGLTGFKERWNRMREIANDPPEQIRINAVDAATYATFQNRMGNIGQGLMALRNGRLSPVFMVLPFVKTPTNILSYTFEHTPLAPLVARWRDDIAAGGGRRDLAIAKMATGTAIMAVAMDAASNGYITGAGPSDQGKKESWLRQGWQANSLRIGDKYYSFNRADPIGMLLGFAGTVAEGMAASDLSPEKYDQATEILAAMIATFSSSVVDKTYFQGIEGVFRAIQSSEQGDQGVQNFINRQTGALMPFSSAFNFHRRFYDPVQREVNSPLDAIKSKIAMWSVDLPPARDIWGEERKPQEVFGRAYDVLSPYAVSQRKESPVDTELQRLNTSLRRIGHKGMFGGADVNFHEWPQVYDRYVVLAGNELKHPAYDMGLKDFLDAVISGKHDLSDNYHNMLSDGPEGGKAAWIKNQVTRFRQMAQQHILRNEADRFPAFVEFINKRRAERLEMKLPIPAQGQDIYNQLTTPQ